MALTRRDAAATLFTGLAVAVYLANHFGWNAYLIGGSNRWAIGAVGILGLVAGLSAIIAGPVLNAATGMLAAIGLGALVIGTIGIVTGSQLMLTVLTLLVVVLWAASTVRHMGVHVPHRHAHAM